MSIRKIDDGDEKLRPAINARMRRDRDLQFFLGIAKGVLMDGRVDDYEVQTLLEWCDAHPEVMSRWPANKVHRCLRDVLADGKIDPSEREEIHAVLSSLSGQRIGDTETPAAILPFSAPPPP